MPEVEVPGHVSGFVFRPTEWGFFFFFFVFSNLWSKNYNGMKERILTDFDILKPVFQAGDRIFHKQWAEFLLENTRKNIYTLTNISSAPKGMSCFSFSLVWEILFCAELLGDVLLRTPQWCPGSAEHSLNPQHIPGFKFCSWTSQGRANSGNSLWNPSSGGGEKLKFCQSKECYFGTCASHSRRNWSNLPVFCEKYINDKRLWKIILQFVAWPFLQWWEFFSSIFKEGSWPGFW